MIDENTPVYPYNYWNEHPDFPSADWRYEVADRETRQGYWEWVKDKIEQAKYNKKEPS